jgi:dihydropteroate synthase
MSDVPAPMNDVPTRPDFRIMGVVNVTPDSFSDGGRYLDAEAAIEHGLALEAEGADILDVGGESTRPGAESVPEHEELRRVIPVIEGLIDRGASAQISIDTSKAGVAARALAAGATLVNDVTALRGDPGMAEVVAQAGAELCLMHMLGDPRTMQRDPHYDDVVNDIRAFLVERMQFATAAGIAPGRLMVDPGIGFGKTVAHNLELLRRLDEFLDLGRPVVIGTSRKSFLGRLTGRDATDDRLAATVATNVLAYERGARVFRVHDVAPVRDALTVTAATVTAPWTTPTSTTR